MKYIPIVSICIPLYNAEEYIAGTIDRLLQQTYPGIEVIIVDDYSTDNSFRIASSYESDNVRVYSNPEKGGNAARNFAFSKATGDYIKFMDADDYCSDSMIEKQMAALLTNGTNDTLVFSPVRMLFNNGEFNDPPRKIDRDYVPGIELLIDIWNNGGFHCPHCHLMHRDLVEKSGGWDESIIKNQDGEFFARVAYYADKALSVTGEYAIWRRTMKGVSANLGLKAHASVIESFGIIINLILSYNNSEENKKICARKMGLYVYTYYPQVKTLLHRIEEILRKHECPLIFPIRKNLRLLRPVVGWKTALQLIHKLNLQ